MKTIFLKITLCTLNEEVNTISEAERSTKTPFNVNDNMKMYVQHHFILNLKFQTDFKRFVICFIIYV